MYFLIIPTPLLYFALIPTLSMCYPIISTIIPSLTDFFYYFKSYCLFLLFQLSYCIYLSFQLSYCAGVPCTTYIKISFLILYKHGSENVTNTYHFFHLNSMQSADQKALYNMLRMTYRTEATFTAWRLCLYASTSTSWRSKKHKKKLANINNFNTEQINHWNTLAKPNRHKKITGAGGKKHHQSRMKRPERMMTCLPDRVPGRREWRRRTHHVWEHKQWPTSACKRCSGWKCHARGGLQNSEPGENRYYS